jgi:hypothetical protein
MKAGKKGYHEVGATLRLLGAEGTAAQHHKEL